VSSDLVCSLIQKNFCVVPSKWVEFRWVITRSNKIVFSGLSSGFFFPCLKNVQSIEVLHRHFVFALVLTLQDLCMFMFCSREMLLVASCESLNAVFV